MRTIYLHYVQHDCGTQTSMLTNVAVQADVHTYHIHIYIYSVVTTTAMAKTRNIIAMPIATLKGSHFASKRKWRKRAWDADAIAAVKVADNVMLLLNVGGETIKQKQKKKKQKHWWKKVNMQTHFSGRQAQAERCCMMKLQPWQAEQALGVIAAVSPSIKWSLSNCACSSSRRCICGISSRHATACNVSHATCSSGNRPTGRPAVSFKIRDATHLPAFCANELQIDRCS